MEIYTDELLSDQLNILFILQLLHTSYKINTKLKQLDTRSGLHIFVQNSIICISGLGNMVL